MKCPKCGSENVFIQNIQTGGKSTGKIVMKEPGRRGCLYWLFAGWMFELVWFMCVGWWWKLLFGWLAGDGVAFIGRTQGKEKFDFETRATCQNCGHTWKVKN